MRLAATSTAGQDAEFGTSGTVITFRGFLAAYEEGRDDERPTRTTSAALPPLAEGDARRGDGARAGGPRDLAARALHRGDARARARGARDRPPVHVRVDHRHDPGPRLRLQEGHGARPVLPRVRRRRSCSSSTSRASSTTTSRRGWRTTSTGSPPATRTGSRWLRRFYFGDGEGEAGLQQLVTDDLAEHRRARGQLDPDPGDSDIVAPRRALRAVRRARRGPGERARGHRARTS